MEYFLGIDVGGTNVKVGLVTSEGELLEKRKYPTADFKQASGGFVLNFIRMVGEELKAHHRVSKVGIGVPGMISKDRQSTVEMANLPSLNDLDLLPQLKKAYPSISFFLENDANAAALGELYFSETSVPDDFLFITLGTGVGSALVLDGKIFKGGNGNAMELGHTICSTGKSVEFEVGKAGIMRMAKEMMLKHRDSKLHKIERGEFDSKKIVKIALKGDEAAREIFKYGGKIIGEGLVNAIRILDVDTVIVGGGVSKTFDLMDDSINAVLKKHLSNYYMNNFQLRLATLGNEAGIIGAASLCFIETELTRDVK
ncbi:MAG: glucokinase [Bacteroidia bacterium]|jgi:glucokinase